MLNKSKQYESIITGYVNQLIEDNNDEFKVENVKGFSEHLITRLTQVVCPFLFVRFNLEKGTNSFGFIIIDPEFHLAAFKEKYKSLYSLPEKVLNTVQKIHNDAKEYISEVFKNFHLDLKCLDSTFNVGANSKIIKIYFSGDPHLGGKATLVLEVSSGVKLVYKPNKVRVFSIVKECLRDFDQYFFNPKRVIRDNYYWEEFILKTDEFSPEKTSKALGILTGFSQITCFSDLHFENIIIHKNRLVILDFETIFDYNTSVYNKKILIDNNVVLLGETPLISSILPLWFRGLMGGYANYSFIGGPSYVGYKRSKYSCSTENKIDSTNSIVLNHKNIYPISVSHFIEGYREFINSKSINVLLDMRVEKVKRRKVYRSTKEYAHIINQVSLQNTKKVKLLFNRKGIPSEVIDKEFESIVSNRDIPYFTEEIFFDKIKKETQKRLVKARKNIGFNEEIVINSIESQNFTADEINTLLSTKNCYNLVLNDFNYSHNS